MFMGFDLASFTAASGVVPVLIVGVLLCIGLIVGAFYVSKLRGDLRRADHLVRGYREEIKAKNRSRNDVESAETKAQEAETKAQEAEAKAQEAETKAKEAETKAQEAEERATTVHNELETIQSRLASARSKLQSPSSDENAVEAYADIMRELAESYQELSLERKKRVLAEQQAEEAEEGFAKEKRCNLSFAAKVQDLENDFKNAVKIYNKDLDENLAAYKKELDKKDKELDEKDREIERLTGIDPGMRTPPEPNNEESKSEDHIEFGGTTPTKSSSIPNNMTTPDNMPTPDLTRTPLKQAQQAKQAQDQLEGDLRTALDQESHMQPTNGSGTTEDFFANPS